jgi:predicted HicB family RNase H-like nuclease
MSDNKTHRTATGNTLGGDDLERLAVEVEETEYDVEELKARRRGRPPMGSGPADVVPVRIDPELKAAIEARAQADHTSTSEIIREAIRRFLDVA